MRVIGPPLSLDNMRWVGDYPSYAAEHFPGRMAIISDEGALSYQELDDAANRFAHHLLSLGLPAGSRIAYLGKNSELLFPVLFGCIRAGAVLLPVNWRYAVPELEYVLRDSGAPLLIYAPEFADTVQRAVARLDAAPALLPTVRTDGGSDSLKAVISSGDASAIRSDDARDLAALQLYTSGTTGRPKGVMLSHRHLSIARWMEMGSPHWSDWTDDDILLSGMPNFHTGGLSWMLIGLLRSLTCILTADPAPGNLLALSRKYNATRTFIVPAVVRALVEMVEGSNLPAPPLKGIFYGAAPMDVALIQRCQKVFSCGFAQYYGMTEACGAVTFFPPAEHRIDRPERLRSVGTLLPGFEMEIRDPDGHVLGPNQPGEIYLRSATIMLGYWQLPEATAEVLSDGWYRSGDGGYFNDEGYLFITDRIKDMIISGAENIYPVEVEQALRQHPAVQDVVVVGVPDPQWGEAVVAVVEWRAGQSATLDELRSFARELIAAYKLPRHLRSVKELPRTPTGKLQRGIVRVDIAKSAAATPEAAA